MVEIDPATFWQMIEAIIVLMPFGFIGIYKIFGSIRDFILVRRGNIKGQLFSENRGIRETWGKPKGSEVELGKNKLYQFTPKKLYRKGMTPVAVYNENSIEQLDPLNEGESKLDTSRLSELLIRYFNLGVISTLSKEKLITIMLLVIVVATIGAVGFSFMNFQAAGMAEGRIINTINAKNCTVISQSNNPASSQNGTVVIG